MNVLLVVMEAESTRTKPGQNPEDRNVQNGFQWKLVQKIIPVSIVGKSISKICSFILFR